MPLHHARFHAARAQVRARDPQPRRLRLLFGGALLIALIWGMAQANAQSIFTCKDDKGRMLTSDRPIPECSKQPMREVSSSGVVKKEFAPPLTPEQLAQKKIDDEKQRVAELKRRQEDARDKALMIAYPSMRSLEVDRERQLTDLKNEMAVVEARMVKEQKQLKTSQAELDKQGATPNALTRRLVQASAASVKADADILERMRGDAVRITQRFDSDAQRLRQLLREPETAQPGKGNSAIASR